MKEILDIQQFNNGYPISNGQLFIGTLNSSDPENNQITVSMNYDNSDTRTGQFDLDNDGRPLNPNTGVPTGIWVDEGTYNGYSLQIVDADNVELFASPRQIEIV